MNDKTGVDPPKNPFFFHLTSPHLKSKLLHILDRFSLFLLRPRSVVSSLPHSQDDVCRSCPWRLAVWVAGSSLQTPVCSLCKTAREVFKAYLPDSFRPHLLFALQERAQEVPACRYWHPKVGVAADLGRSLPRSSLERRNWFVLPIICRRPGTCPRFASSRFGASVSANAAMLKPTRRPSSRRARSRHCSCRNASAAVSRTSARSSNTRYASPVRWPTTSSKSSLIGR